MATNRTLTPPLPIGALLRFAIDDVRTRIYEGVAAAGFDDIRPAHVTLFRWPGPDGRRPTAVATDTGLSKQRVNDLLRDLEARGYLELEPDPVDSRGRIIRLTPRGRKLHGTATAVHEAIEEDWRRAVGARRFDQLRATLRELTDEAV